MDAAHYDILIVGAGVAGSALAHALSTITSRLRGASLRVALLERSLSEPDRMVGELLLPAGITVLQKLGMGGALEGIDSVPELGFCFLQSTRLLHVPYPDGIQGGTFHHGRFIMRLRDYAKCATGVDVIEATVNELIECETTKRVLGIRATRSSANGVKESFFADLVIMADGGSSNFRNVVLGKSVRTVSTPGYTFGIILKDVQIPMPQYGNVAILEGHGGIFGMLQLSEHDTRFMTFLKRPPPPNIKEWILENVIPHIPASLHTAFREALDRDRIRRMPNSYMPSVVQGGKYTKEGVFLLGDSWHMRHPVAAGGMTIALNDVLILSTMLGKVEDFSDWDEISDVLVRWYWARKQQATVMSLVSIAFDAIMTADDEYMSLFRNAAIGYMACGDKDVQGLMSIMAGVAYSPAFVFYHVYKIAIYTIWFIFAHPQPVTTLKGETEATLSIPSVWQYPSLLIKCVRMFWTVSILFAPIVWSEIQWW